jgi:hypothetical protein
MQHIFRRCKHCGKTYTYCTYGNGPGYGTEPGCSMDYCADCQNAINDALAKIPIRYIKKHIFVSDQEEITRLKTIFEDEKAKHYTNANIIQAALMIPDWGFDEVEKCYIDWVEYYKCVEDDGRILFQVAMEYDTVEGKFTGKKYEETEGEKRRYIPVSQLRFPKLTKIKEQNMTPPSGEVFYMDTNWEVVLNKKDTD